MAISPFHEGPMRCSVDQAMLYFVDLRVQVRDVPEAREIVDRCLRILCTAKTAEAATMVRLEAEVEALRRDLLRRFGPPRGVTPN